MTRARDIANLVDANGDIAAGALDNVPAADVVNDTTPQLGGNLDTNGNDVTFGDNDKAVFGAGSDLQIYYDTVNGNSVIHDAGAGNLRIRADDFQVTNAAVTANLIFANDATGEVKLYHNGTEKLATTSTGVDVTGNATFDDNGKAIFGAGSDLQIYHDGTNSIIAEASVGGSLKIQGSDLYLTDDDGTNMLYAANNGGVTLYNGGGAKLATTATGVSVTGTVAATSYTGDGSGLTGVGVDGISSSSTSGTAINIDANNVVTTPTRHCFWWAYSTGGAATGLTGVINWNVTEQQSGGHTASSDFTCPVAGLYQFNFNAFGGANSSGGNVGGTTDPRLEVSTDGGSSYQSYAIGYTYAVDSDHPRSNICFATVLPANAKVRIRISTGRIFASNNQVNTTFSGYLVSQGDR